MSKRLAVISIVLWSIIALVAVLIFVNLMAGGANMFKLSDTIPNGELIQIHSQTVSDDISDIDVEWVRGRVTVHRSDDDQIKMTQSAGAASEKTRLMTVSVNGTSLKISDHRRGWFNFIRLGQVTYLDLYLPDKMYDIVNISSVSGNVDCTDIRAGDLTVENVSGNSTVGGQAETVRLSSVSGSITGDNLTAKSLYADAVSGKITLGGAFDSIDAETVSGSVRIESDAMPRSVKSDTVSGSVTLIIPENDGFSVTLDKVSGKLTSDFDLVVRQGDKHYVYKDGGASFDIDLVSGSVNILKKSVE